MLVKHSSQPKIDFQKSIKSLLKKKQKQIQVNTDKLLQIKLQNQNNQQKITLPFPKTQKPKVRLSLCNFQLKQTKYTHAQQNPISHSAQTNSIALQHNSSTKLLTSQQNNHSILQTTEKYHTQNIHSDKNLQSKKNNIYKSEYFNNNRLKRGHSLNIMPLIQNQLNRENNSAESQVNLQNNHKFLPSVKIGSTPRFHWNYQHIEECNSSDFKKEKEENMTFEKSKRITYNCGIKNYIKEQQIKYIRKKQHQICQNEAQKLKFQRKRLQKLNERVSHQNAEHVTPQKQLLCGPLKSNQQAQNQKYFYISNLSLKTPQKSSFKSKLIDKKPKHFSNQQGYSPAASFNSIHQKLYSLNPVQLHAAKANLFSDNYKLKNASLGKIQINFQKKTKPTIVKEQNIISGWQVENQEQKQLED